MKLKNLLENIVYESRSDPIYAEEARDILESVSDDIIVESPKVYRGKTGESILRIDPSQYVRTSANADNHYTLWIDNNWPDKYPKRSRSIICGTSTSIADRFGLDNYVIIPLQNYNFGVCSTVDIWTSFQVINDQYYTDLPGFFLGTLSHFIARATDGEISKLTDESYEKMIEQIKIIDDLSDEELKRIGSQEPTAGYDNPRSWSIFAAKFISYRKTGGDILSFLDNEVLDPEKNGFQVKKYTEDMPDNKEVWTSGECLMIEVNWFNKVFKDLL